MLTESERTRIYMNGTFNGVFRVGTYYAVAYIFASHAPTLSLGMSLSSLPCFRKTFPGDKIIIMMKTFITAFIPAVCSGLMPTPEVVMIADVA